MHIYAYFMGYMRQGGELDHGRQVEALKQVGSDGGWVRYVSMAYMHFTRFKIR